MAAGSPLGYDSIFMALMEILGIILHHTTLFLLLYVDL